jgi:hypothetical protein
MSINVTKSARAALSNTFMSVATSADSLNLLAEAGRYSAKTVKQRAKYKHLKRSLKWDSKIEKLKQSLKQ